MSDMEGMEGESLSLEQTLKRHMHRAAPGAASGISRLSVVFP